MNKDKIFFHVDVNSAFLSWTAVEHLKNGEKEDIRNIPSAIGGDPKKRTGIILAKSTSAKKLGVVTGEPLNMALKKCPSLKIYPPDFEVYVRSSMAMGKILENYSPNLEQFSVDEYFMEYVPILGSYMDVARSIQKEIFEKIGVTVNIGISTNKILAKMASDFEKPNKIHTLFLDELETKMWPLPIEELFMCGRQTSAKLRTIGINTIGKLANANLDLLTYHFKSRGSILRSYANGTYVAEIKEREKNKCYSNSVTTKMDLDDLVSINAVLLNVSETVSRRLRKHDAKVKTVAVDVKLNTFQTYSRATTLSKEVSTTKEIYDVAIKLFKDSWDGRPVRLLGISLSNLVYDENLQTDLFNLQNVKQDNLDHAIDKLMNSFNKDFKICRASSLFASDHCSGKEE
ncbi:MAG: DNA polymerase IV [Clostridia bacterium]